MAFLFFQNTTTALLADVNQLEKTKEIWAKKSDLPAIHFDLEQQITNMRHFCLPYQKEYIGNEVYLDAIKNHFPASIYL